MKDHTPAAPTRGLFLHRAPDLEALAEGLRARLAAQRDDPFRQDLVAVPGPGVQRWLSQHLATASGAGGEGICAGIDFMPVGRLLDRATGTGPAGDPWRSRRVTWAVWQVLQDNADDPLLAGLQAHLEASTDDFAVSRRLARLLIDYGTWRPAMLDSWRDGRDVDPSGGPLGIDAWQPRLWRLVREALGGVDAVEAHRDRLALLQAQPADLPPEVSVFAPRQLPPGRWEELEALSLHHRVDVWLRHSSAVRWAKADQLGVVRGSRDTAGPRRLGGHRLNARLGRQEWEQQQLLPTSVVDLTGLPAAADSGPGHSGIAGFGQAPLGTLLGWLADDIRDDASHPHERVVAPRDTSIQLHACHGLDRQIEVLRDVLAGLFSDDPTLEPRDVLVITPDPDAVAPLAAAAFPPGGEAGHPAHGFRVRLVGRDAGEVNPPIGVLLRLLHLMGTRFEASRLLDLCAEPLVAGRFGFTGEDLKRLGQLVTDRAAIRWGLNPRHRARYGLGQVRQNTWLAGVRRMLLGVALSEDGLPSVGTVFPVDDIDSSDLGLIGGLTEFVGRLDRFSRACEGTAPLATWLELCRQALDWFVAVPPSAQWQLSQALAGLAAIADHAGTGTVDVGQGEIASLIEDEFVRRGRRAAFGNGSLFIAAPDNLRGVPHRVICLLGFDEGRYPRHRARSGDDLVSALPWVGDPDPRSDDRQVLLDAILAAREKLIVLYQARHPATNEPTPAPAPLVDLFDALDDTAGSATADTVRAQVSTHHPLQPFDPRYFGPNPSSFDQVALSGARALVGERRAAPPVFSTGPLPRADIDAMSLEDLVAFFQHPVRALMRQRGGLSGPTTTGVDDEIPIDPGFLGGWQVGQRILQLARQGHGAAEVLTAERLRGGVPPGDLGTAFLNGIIGNVDQVMRRLPPSSAATPEFHEIDLDLGGVRLTGRLTTHAGELIDCAYSSLSARQRLGAWIRLLALTAEVPGSWRSLVVTKSGSGAWTSPPADAAALHLRTLLRIYAHGMNQPLPLPARVAESWAEARRQHQDPLGDAQRRLNQSWRLDQDTSWARFYDFDSLLAEPRPPGEWGAPHERTALGLFAELVWQPILTGEVLA